MRSMTKPLLYFGLGAAGVWLAVACGSAQNAETAGASAGPTSASGMSASASSASAGGAAGCMDASGCPPPTGPCAGFGKATCTDHACGLAYTAGVAPVAYGSCKKNQCDAMGVLSTVADDGNAFAGSNPCVPWSCHNGMPMVTTTPGASCSTPKIAMGVCLPPADPTSAAGLLCAACDPTKVDGCKTVPGAVCSKGTCVPPSCANKNKDGQETDVDCGGPSCLPCVVGDACAFPNDCFSKVCVQGKCAAPSCSDGVQNGAETDVDCGGTCPPCAANRQCGQPSDCASGVCKPGGPEDYCQTPSCSDGVKNGDETGIDCGGSCPPCAK